jgi:8-amino-7-oxononanoate synthase
MYELYKQYCIKLEQINQYRQLPNLLDSTEIIDFTNNDYLSLSKRPEILIAAYNAGKKYGIGATGSRLLSGNSEIFHQLESQIAIDKATETSLIFNSGFQANATVLASLLDQTILNNIPIVFFDKLNHVSLYHSVFLSKAQLVRYKHNDMNHLGHLLNYFSKDNRPKFIVAETVFGMDGHILPLDQIVHLAKKHSAFLYLDEAHATGIIGKNGYGLSTTISLKEIPHLIMGTFSKALGGSGAYIACSEIIKNYIINKTSGFIYSTANSPMVIGAALQSWQMIRNFEPERKSLFNLAKYLREQLTDLGFNIGASETHIIPIIMAQENLVISAKEKLLAQGITVSAIRPPSVPLGTSRLRIALNVNHSQTDIDLLIKALRTI